MWVAEMDYPTAPAILQALRAGLDTEALGYPSGRVMGELGVELAAWLARTSGWTVDPADVHVVGDVMHGVRLAVDYFGAPDDPVVIPSPVYPPFFEVVALTGRPQVAVPMRWSGARWELDLTAIDSALAAGAKTILLCHPHNPLGRVFEATELAALAEIVDRHGARVVSDEIHAPLALTRPHIPYAVCAPSAAGHTITVTSASKSWNVPGLKCAQVITTAPGDTDTWSRIPAWEKVGVSTLGMVAARAAYRDGEPWLAEVRATLTEHARLVADAVDTWPGVSTVANEGTYLQWLDFGELGLGREPAEWLRTTARVALNPGPPFGAEEHRFARLNFATTRPLLELGLERIAEAVRSRMG